VSDPRLTLFGMTLLLLLRSPTVEPKTDAEAEAITRRLGMPHVAAHHVYEVHLYPPITDEDYYLGELRNPDTGLVDLAISSNAAEALRQVAQSLADDV
jgi:hypothetical protein